MNNKIFKLAILFVTAILFSSSAYAGQLANSTSELSKYTSRVVKWDGPTTGPSAAENKTILVLAGDLKNAGILGVTNGVKEAASAIGWKVQVLDGAGSISGRRAVFGQAMALKPDGIIINGFDAVEQSEAIKQAKSAHIPMVSWHAATEVGPLENLGVSANITTDQKTVSKVAAEYAFVNAKGKMGVVILTDSTYAVAIAKANEMKAEIERLGGTVLEFIDTPIAETSSRMPQLTTSLLLKYGDQWTHTLAINDIYFDFISPSLISAGLPGDGKPVNIAAGDGSESAYHRIKAKQYQAVTVAEPLNLQGWQLIDELNRVFAGEKWSGYVSPLHVVTIDNIAYDGGANNKFDPDNNYREEYKKIWKK